MELNIEKQQQMFDSIYLYNFLKRNKKSINTILLVDWRTAMMMISKEKRKEKKKRKIWLRLINPNHFAMLFNEVEGMGIFFNIQVIYQQDYHVKKR